MKKPSIVCSLGLFLSLLPWSHMDAAVVRFDLTGTVSQSSVSGAYVGLIGPIPAGTPWSATISYSTDPSDYAWIVDMSGDTYRNYSYNDLPLPWPPSGLTSFRLEVAGLTFSAVPGSHFTLSTADGNHQDAFDFRSIHAPITPFLDAQPEQGDLSVYLRDNSASAMDGVIIPASIDLSRWLGSTELWARGWSSTSGEFIINGPIATWEHAAAVPEPAEAGLVAAAICGLAIGMQMLRRKAAQPTPGA